MIRLLNSSTRNRTNKTVVVFGCARGGTSAAAGMLRELGVLFPENTDPFTHESSPVAYRGDEVEPGATRANIRRLQRAGIPCGWKYPRDIYSVHHWISYLENPHFLIVLRNPFDTINSAMRHEDVQFSLVAKHVGEVNEELGRFIAFMPYPMAVLSYEGLRTNPKHIVSELVRWLDLATSDAQAEAAVDFVSGRLPGYRQIRKEAAHPSSSMSHGYIAANKGRTFPSALFKSVNAELRARIDHLIVDNTAAKQIVGHLSTQVSVLQQDIVLAGNCIDTDEHDGTQLDDRTTPDKSELYNTISDDDRFLIKATYGSLWDQYSLVLRERVILQGQMEDLARRRDFLLQLEALETACDHPIAG